MSATDDHRRVFRRMMEEVLAPASKVDTILVPTTSRFMRNVDKARFHKSRLKRHGIRVIATKQETSDDASGHLAEGMFELFDQYESEINGMRTAAGLREAARQGFFPSPHPPFGFRRERVGGALKRHKLVPHLDEVAQHNDIFRTYVNVGGSKSTAQDLNRRELRYRDGRRFTKDTVLRIIDEQAAIGTYLWNRYDSKSGHEQPEEEWIPIPCEPIIDRELWDLAQKVRKERDPKRSAGRTSSSPLLLGGIIWCGKCGASYQLETSGKAPPSGGREYRYYNCRSFCRTGRDKCAGARIPTNQLDKAIVEHLADQLFTEERCQLILKDILQESGLLRRKANEQLQLMHTELEALRQKRGQDAPGRGISPYQNEERPCPGASLS